MDPIPKCVPKDVSNYLTYISRSSKGKATKVIVVLPYSQWKKLGIEDWLFLITYWFLLPNEKPCIHIELLGWQSERSYIKLQTNALKTGWWSSIKFNKNLPRQKIKNRWLLKHLKVNVWIHITNIHHILFPAKCTIFTALSMNDHRFDSKPEHTSLYVVIFRIFN